jgi:Mg-chelatase subunit ChlD
MATNFTATFTQSATSGLLTVAVTANVQAPVYFMRILGFQNITISNAGSATRRALVVMLVLDVSGSMQSSTYQGETACDYMKTAATNFTTNFSAYDYMGLITFDSTAHLTYAPTTDWGETAESGLLRDQVRQFAVGGEHDYVVYRWHAERDQRQQLAGAQFRGRPVRLVR